MTPEQIRKIVQDELRKSNAGSRFHVNSIPQHVHNGTDSPKINQQDILPNTRASGSITFARNAQYTLGLNFNPTAILFYGTAIDSSGYTFTLAENVTNTVAGATYSNNGEVFTVTANVDSGQTTMSASGTGDPETSGSLIKIAGVGEPVIDYSSFVATGSITTRGFGIGNAQLGPSYYFQPGDASSVKIGGPLQDFIQSSSSVTIAAGGFVTTVSEGTLFRVGYPNNSLANLKATAQIASFDKTSIKIDVTLASGWSIIGNYVVT